MRIHSLVFIALLTLACGKKKPAALAEGQSPTSADFKKGEYFYDSTSFRDSAFFYFNNVTENTSDSLLAATAYSYMAMIQYDAGDYYGVQESALAGIQLADEKNPEHLFSLASLYNTLGRSNISLKEYNDAIRHFNNALAIQPYEGYKNFSRNNIAVAFRQKGDYRQALRVLDSIPAQNDETKAEYARRITNIASLKWKADSTFNPIPALLDALTIRLAENDNIGITASYNHLSDYFLVKNNDSALFYTREMYTFSQKTGNTEDQLDALRKLSYLVPLDESRSFFERYEILSDSLQTARSAAKNQFAIIRYESEKSKAENLLLLEDNAQKELEILRQQILLVGGISLVAVIAALSIRTYRKKRREAEQKALTAIKENQLRMSQKIHDTVANGLYRMMSEIEHKEIIEKEALLDKIEELYEQSRDISYEQLTPYQTSAEEVNTILTSFATPETKVLLVGNNKAFWEGIPVTIVKELGQVLQELLVNMKKHSGAKHVVFNFSKSKNHLKIIYKDDGSGFQPNFKKGNGLMSTENRINHIGGEISFTPGTANGAKIKIIVPTNFQ